MDAFGALLSAAAVLGFCLLGMKAWIFREQVFVQGPQVSQPPQVVLQEVQPLLREVFPECWERDREDLARVFAKIGVPRSILRNIAFEHGLEVSVDEVRTAARMLVASEPVTEEMSTKAASAPSGDLRARSREEQKIHEKKWSTTKKVSKRCSLRAWRASSCCSPSLKRILYFTCGTGTSSPRSRRSCCWSCPSPLCSSCGRWVAWST